MVVSHASQWPFSSYKEIQEPRRKNVLIDYERVQRLLEAGFYDQVRVNQKGWVEAYLEEREKVRRVASGSLPQLISFTAFHNLPSFGPEPQ
jgi:hypothetical protein